MKTCPNCGSARISDNPKVFRCFKCGYINIKGKGVVLDNFTKIIDSRLTLSEN